MCRVNGQSGGDTSSVFTKMYTKTSVFLLVVSVFITLYWNCSGEKIIATNSGSVRGLRETSLWKKVDFHAFRGIPYAKPPVDELRFKVSTLSVLLLFVKK